MLLSIRAVTTGVPLSWQNKGNRRPYCLSPRAVASCKGSPPANMRTTERYSSAFAHKEDVHELNTIMLHANHNADSTVQLSKWYNIASYETDLQVLAWLQDPDFHELTEIAVGCIITSNVQVGKGAAKGDSGTVSALEWENGEVVRIIVTLDSTGDSVPVRRSVAEKNGAVLLAGHT